MKSKLGILTTVLLIGGLYLVVQSVLSWSAYPWTQSGWASGVTVSGFNRTPCFLYFLGGAAALSVGIMTLSMTLREVKK